MRELRHYGVGRAWGGMEPAGGRGATRSHCQPLTKGPSTALDRGNGELDGTGDRCLELLLGHRPEPERARGETGGRGRVEAMKQPPVIRAPAELLRDLGRGDDPGGRSVPRQRQRNPRAGVACAPRVDARHGGQRAGQRHESNDLRHGNPSLCLCRLAERYGSISHRHAATAG
jgi:hypothetical protein